MLKKWGLDWRTQDSSGPCYVSTFLQQKKDFQTINDMQINQSLIITDNVLNMGLQSLNLKIDIDAMRTWFADAINLQISHARS